MNQVFNFFNKLFALSLKTQKQWQAAIDQCKKAEEQLRQLNTTLEQRMLARTAELESALREVSAYKHAINEAAVLSVTNQAGIITHINHNFCKLSKYNEEELLGQDHRMINSGYHSKEFIEAMWKTIEGGEIWKGELKNRTKDGMHYWIDATIVPFLNEYGKPYQYIIIGSDITARKLAERYLNNLLKELSDYKYALDEAALVAISDEHLIFKYVNDNFCKALEYSRAELIGQSLAQFNAIANTSEFVNTLLDTIKNGKLWKGEIKNKTKYGRELWFEATIVPFLNNEGKPYQYVAIRTDITERKLAEEKIAALVSNLERSEKQFRAMIENSKDVFIISDKNGVAFVSPSIRQVQGYTEEEYRRLSPEDVVHPDDLPLKWESLAKPGSVMNLEFRSRHKNGEWRWLEGTGMNLNEVEGVQGIVFTLRDITERKETERRLIESEKIYKTIASNIPGSFICLIDKEHRYLVAEGDMLQKVGYPKEKILFKKVTELLPAATVQEVLPNLDRVFKGETLVTETRRGGYDMVYRYVPFKLDNEEEVYAVMVVGIDVSPLKKAQEEVMELNSALEQKIKERTAELEQVNKELESFSYSVSHDLRSPLRAVNGYANMLEEEYHAIFDKEGKRLLSVIQYNAMRMGNLIDDLLEFSRIGKKEVQKTMVDMQAMVNAIIEELLAGAPYHAAIQTGHLQAAYADGALIKQVLTNFISNALKYSSRKEKPQVTIQSYVQNDEIIYSVNDNGTGFDMQYQQKLFNVFERLHTTEEFEGTGVGLAIVKRIIDKHHGRVWATGEPDKGATFYFSLPAENDL